MQIDSLKYFVQVAELKSITKVASKSHISQPALSQQLSKLELELGASLFERSNRGVEITAQGEILYKHAKNILSGYERLFQDMEISTKLKNDVRINISSISSKFLVSNISSKMFNIFGDLDLKLSTQIDKDWHSSIINNNTDVIVGTKKIEDSDIISKNIGSDEFILISRKKISISSIKKLNVALLDDGTECLNDIKERNVKFITNSLSTVKNYLDGDNTAAVVPRIAVLEELKSSDFYELNIEKYNLKYDLFVIYKKSLDVSIKRKITKFSKEIELILKECNQDRIFLNEIKSVG
ncbi:LysR family transcriptional regulator [uncultured Clostridium sp.]|uniref:LysR family transcriptional regulator n=1 Tax=uncultured Clostridium sp. TaxID=59620 RepID=UPI00262BD375|nr:LysR family transcriptional regulator [uncultured Clostridium sp.]